MNKNIMAALITLLCVINPFVMAQPADTQSSVFELNCNQSRACEMAKVDEIGNIISKRVAQNWSATQSQRELRAKVHLVLNNQGEIELLEVDLSSGDQAFDESLKNAIYQSFPIEQIQLIKPEIFSEHLQENRIMFLGGQF